jgi:hypothetical protein
MYTYTSYMHIYIERERENMIVIVSLLGQWEAGQEKE